MVSWISPAWKRHYYCQQELALNRKLSPQLYLNVRPVYQHGATYNLNGPGKVVDYCLQMLQFDQSDLFDHKLAQAQLDAQWMDQLPEHIARLHQQAEINSADTFDHAHFLAEHIRDNLNIAAKHTDRAINHKKLRELSSSADSTLSTQQLQLRQRQIQQHIRHCHGDLHLRNITLLHGKPSLFDCIEFNDTYRIIDSMNDVAFLLMDCDAHAHTDLGMRFLSRYLEYCGDYAGLELLPLYLFYRATVRGKVACILAEELPPEQQQPQWQEAQSYFTLASTYGNRDRPSLFAIGGLSGSGKSYLSRLGSAQEYAIIIRSDATRQHIAADYVGLELYGRDMYIHTYNSMFQAACTALQAGFSVILDATFLHPDSRQQVHQLASACRVPLHFYWLDVEVGILKNNICTRQHAGHDISAAGLAVLKMQLAEYQRPDEAYIQFLTSSQQWPEKQLRNS